MALRVTSFIKYVKAVFYITHALFKFAVNNMDFELISLILFLSLLLKETYIAPPSNDV